LLDLPLLFSLETPTAPTPNLWDSDTSLATTAFVKGQGYLTGYHESDPQIGSMTTNYLSKWNGSSLVSSQIVDNGTNIGIGVPSPTVKLEVAGLIRSTNNGTAYLQWGDDATLNDVNIANTVGIIGIQDSTRGAVQLGSNANSYLAGLWGNIGIGTKDPAYKLDVNGNGIFREGLRVQNAWGAYTYITLWDDESPNGVKYVHANSNVIWFLNGWGGWSAYWDNSGNQQTYGGINAQGNINTEGTIQWKWNLFIRPQDNGVEWWEIQLMNSNPEWWRNGIIAIDNYNQWLRIFRWKNAPAEYTEYAIFQPNKTYIWMQGNVGIGTADPTAKLEVAGDIKFASTLSTPGRMHITGGENLYLLNRGGVYISKAWGGNGNLDVEGNITTVAPTAANHVATKAYVDGKASTPPICTWADKALQWDGTNWICKTIEIGSLTSYAWSWNSWSACTASCGWWTHSRTVVCKRNDGSTVADSNCSFTTKPDTSEECNTASCAPSKTYHTERYVGTVDWTFWEVWTSNWTNLQPVWAECVNDNTHMVFINNTCLADGNSSACYHYKKYVQDCY
jgi:hypothetical protein